MQFMGLKLNEYHGTVTHLPTKGYFSHLAKLTNTEKCDVKKMSKHNPVTFTMSVKHIKESFKSILKILWQLPVDLSLFTDVSVKSIVIGYFHESSSFQIINITN